MGHVDLVRALIASLPVAIVVLDRDARVVACNAVAEELFRLEPGGAIGRAFVDLPPGHRVPGLRAAVEQARHGVLPAALEAFDDAGLPVAYRVVPVRHEDGDLLLVTADDRSRSGALAVQVRVLEDEVRASRSETDTANAELQATNEELSAANAQLHARLAELEDALQSVRHKDDFLAMLAHELRNPLAPILSAMQVIRLHPENADVVRRAREVVERQVRHQARLLDDLLDVSRVTRGRITLRKARVDLASAVAAAIEATRPVIDARHHALSVTLPAEPLRLEADPTRLTQIVTNLLDNAAKYTSPGGVITLTAERDGGHAALRVRDTGVGIPAEMQSRVFDLFTQVDPPISRSLGGLGLGLALVRSLVELHGGTVQVASDGPGRGSEFSIRLPLDGGDAERQAEAPAAAGARRHVLVIEDNADAREMLRMALELDGHRVETAEDGLAGVEIALRTTPDVVLVDIGLPGLDGYAVARRLRARLGRRVTLVALTGYGQAEDRGRATEAGFDAHMVKPVDPEALTRAIAVGFGVAA